MSERDPYSWEIVSRDGEIAHQFEGDVEVGEFARDWDHRRFEIAAITARPVNDLKPAIGVQIPTGCRAVYHWNRRRHLDPNTGREWKGASVLALGFESITDSGIFLGGIYVHVDAEGNVIITDSPVLPID